MKTPWAEWLAAARRLGVRPPEFWRLSLWEWQALTAGAVRPPDQNELNELMRAHPDAQGDST